MRAKTVRLAPATRDLPGCDLEITMNSDDRNSTKLDSPQTSRRRPGRVIDAPTVNGRPITLVTAPETHGELPKRDRDSISFWDSAATFCEGWRREMAGAELVPRVRFGRGTSAQEIVRPNTGVEREPDALDDTAPSARARPTPTVEIDPGLLDEVARLREATASNRTHASHTAEPSADFEPSHANWLGVATSQPQLGASLVIAESASEFMLTSAVTQIVAHLDGVFVQTLNTRYFVAQSGDTFLV
jgi:hypothetical protein